MSIDIQGAVFGHTAVVTLLQRLATPVQQLTQSNLRHAYLLLGARQVGKRTVAEMFAKALLCTDAIQRPCAHCRNCRLLAQGNHPDFRRFVPLDKNGAADRLGGVLRVEQAAEIIRDVVMRPMEGQYKIFIIQDLHMANDSFANKLLKTLEEPPDHAIFILTALGRNQVLPTIVSRCQLLELRPLASPTIAHALHTNWQVEKNEADLLSRLARGRLGWAIQQLTQETKQVTRLNQLEALWRLMEAPLGERLTVAEKLNSITERQQLFELLETWGAWWRDILLVQADCVELCSNIDQVAKLKEQAAIVPGQEIHQYLRTLDRIEGYLHHTVNTRLALEVLLLKAPGLRVA